MASASDKFKKVGTVGTVTTLQAPGHSISGTSINIGSGANWPTDTGVVFAIRQVDTNGDLVAGTYTEWRGVLSGTTISGMVLVDGSDQVYPAGATTQVYIPVSATRDNDMVDGLLEEHKQTGAHEDITADTIAVSGVSSLSGHIDMVSGKSIRDDNDNELLTVIKVTSAVNNLQITNAATGNGPILEAIGGDTNIDLNIKPKGTGLIKMLGLTGWQAGSGTWTYASATTMTVPAADAALMRKGTKILLTQTTDKYFYVVGVSGTTITLSGGSDYSLANAAITSPKFSNFSTPEGFPTWFNWAPTYTGFSSVPSTIVAQFQIIGDTCLINVTSNNGTSNANTFTISLPITSATISNMAWRVMIASVDNGTAGTGSDYGTVGSNATAVTLAHNDNNAGWTTSGSKGASFQMAYRI